LPAGLLPVSPDFLVFEVRSPDQRWSELHLKVAEFLNAGVQVACVVDDDTRTVEAHFADRGTQLFEAENEFSVLNVLGDFRVPAKRFFE
jgi:Uma2 family endonuclease